MRKSKPIPGTEHVLPDFFEAFFAECRERELGPRFFIIIVATNDAVQVARAEIAPEGGFKVVAWAEHSVGDIMVLPVTIGAINPETGSGFLGRIDAGGLLHTMN